jgi:hypothetical protein
VVQLQRDPARPGVFDRVGERLLHHVQHGVLERDRAHLQQQRLHLVHRPAGGLLHRFDLRAQRGAGRQRLAQSAGE